jgi:hypothetical protein
MAAASSWTTKPAAQWTEEEAREVLEKSPWAAEVKAAIARRLTEDELRDAGQMGQSHGVGYDGVDPKGSGPKTPTPKSIFLKGDKRSVRSMAQPVTLRVRWESALPVRLAELKSRESGPPTLPMDGYCIAVSGVPGGYFKADSKQLGNPLKKDAVLRREGKKDVKPSSVEVFQRADGLTVVYLFPLSAEIIRNDGYVEFTAQIGRVIVAHRFYLAEMVYLGKLEL